MFRVGSPNGLWDSLSFIVSVPKKEPGTQNFLMNQF